MTRDPPYTYTSPLPTPHPPPPHTPHTPQITEEEDEPIFIQEPHRGDYVVVFDPLDGSSNIDCGVSGGGGDSVCVWGGCFHSSPVFPPKTTLTLSTPLECSGHHLWHLQGQEPRLRQLLAGGCDAGGWVVGAWAWVSPPGTIIISEWNR